MKDTRADGVMEVRVGANTGGVRATQFKGHKSVDCWVALARRVNAQRAASLAGQGPLQATADAEGQVLGRRADCEQEESSENTKGLEEHRGRADCLILVVGVK